MANHWPRQLRVGDLARPLSCEQLLSISPEEKTGASGLNTQDYFVSKFFLRGRMGKVPWGFVHRQEPDFRLCLFEESGSQERKTDSVPGHH